MGPEPPDAATRQQAEIDNLRGQVHALYGIIAVLIANFAILARDPLAKREEILRSLHTMLPQALAKIERSATPATSAGFERAVEMVTHLARTAIRFKAAPPRQ
ncbi:hypothetical protein GCM10011504_29300 [Siccirubricoccus deserti]|uniref:Uncharacterized protein n=1 Tax=Siccirubricoccus deserti TaxID=2013562 RepID=A0A9X0UE54_9PROT|nr:hypothetical protein [Siccirubricoccus deserti]MBC4016436.1 hypothetical protein [Siccirubricoccus deserti]GGC49046.1 hypothetical protein GCM10011504_29300 [Siccirubricoccus deserti]